MTNDELIQSLVAELRPVRRLRDVKWRTLAWACVAFALAFAGTIALGPRADLLRKLADPSFLAENAALLALFVASAGTAFQLSVPGLERRPLARVLPAVGLAAWFLLVAVRQAATAEAVRLGSGWPCVLRMAWLAAAPAAVAFMMLRRGAPLRAGWTGLYAVLSAGALGIVGTQALCANDGPGHVLLWHLAPLLVVAALGLAVGRVLLARGRLSDPRRPRSRRS